MEVLLGGVVAAAVSAIATLLTRSFERRHQDELLKRELEHQTRDTLRRTYADVLVTQRRSREASLRLARAGGAAGNEGLAEAAIAAHDEFIDHYHLLNLDSSREMWLEARGLRHVLDEMLKLAQAGSARECETAADFARAARQNLEGGFRNRLGYQGHQARRNLGDYDKVDSP